ncbi:hypothetical protein BC936DRAFT_144541 [Jimgerdemannia flammicorona]|uniref:Pentacotripeptide-repeat region of PRORP domain-containing protein n=1 Tax=Jimgerdemannia flammicorona TaxID=994334 RepID=A0A433DCA7_9FUNG|nr:hypothetical protein BC936DRAFT_144541 [Jimgerdemannia flammicorona]
MQLISSSSLTRFWTRKQLLPMLQTALPTTGTHKSATVRLVRTSCVEMLGDAFWKLTRCWECHHALGAFEQTRTNFNCTSPPGRFRVLPVFTTRHSSRYCRPLLYEQKSQFPSPEETTTLTEKVRSKTHLRTSLAEGFSPSASPIPIPTNPAHSSEQARYPSNHVGRTISNYSRTQFGAISPIQSRLDWTQVEHRAFLAHLTVQRRWSEVLQVIRDMRSLSSRNIRIEAFEYEALILALAATEKESDKVVALYNVVVANYLNIIRTGTPPSSTDNNSTYDSAMRPTVLTFKTVLARHFSRREFYIARRVFRDISEIGGWEPDVETFATMVWGLLDAGELGTAKEFWRKMVASGGESRGNQRDIVSGFAFSDMRSAFVWAYVERGALEEAVNTVREFCTTDKRYSPGLKDLRLLIQGFIDRGEASVAVDVLEEFAGGIDLLQEAMMLGPLVKATDAMGWWGQAMTITEWRGKHRQIASKEKRQLFIGLLSSMMEGDTRKFRLVYKKLSGCKALVEELLARMMLGTHARIANSRGLDRIFTRMKGPPSIHTFERLLDEFTHEAKFDAIDILYSRMRSLQLQDCPSRRLYDTIIDGFASKGLYKEAAQWHDRLMRDGAQPSATAVHSLIRASIDAGDLNVAMTIYDSITAPLMATNTVSIPPSPLASAIYRTFSPKYLIHVYTTLVRALAKQPCSVGPQNVDSLATIRRLCADMHYFSLLPNERFYNALLLAMSRTGNMASARKLYADMKASDIQPTAYTFAILMDAVNKQGSGVFRRKRQHFKAIIALLKEMSSMGVEPDMVVSGIILDVLVKNGDTKSAVELMKKMKRMAKAGLNGKGNNAEKYGNASAKLDAGLSTWMVNKFMNAMAESRNRPEVRRIWKNEFGDTRLLQLHYAERERVLRPDAVSFTTVIKANLKLTPSKGRRHAESELKEMVRKGLYPTPPTLVHILSAHLECRDSQAVFETVEQFEKRWGIRPDELGWRRILGLMATERDVEGLIWGVRTLCRGYVEDPQQVVLDNLAKPVKYRKKRRFKARKDAIRRKTDEPSVYDVQIARGGRSSSLTSSGFTGHTAQTNTKRKPPMTFLNKVFVPRLLSRIFEAIFAGSNQANVRVEDRALSILDELQAAGVYIADEAVKTLIPEMVNRGWTAKDVWRTVVREWRE